MKKSSKCFMPRLLLRAALLAIALAVTSSGATGGALAQDEDAKTALEANLDRVARETAELRELPPLADIDDVLVSHDELLAMMPELIAEDITP